MNSSHMFIHLPQHRVIVCQSCKYAVLPDNVDTHLSHPTRHKFNKQQRDKIIKEVRLVEGLIYNTKGLEAFVFPDSSGFPIPELQAAHQDGFQCNICGYISRSERKMQIHCKSEHQWQNDQKGGRPSREKRESPRERPWRKGVHSQQFFIQGPKSRFFEVAAVVGVAMARPVEVDKLGILRRVTEQRLQKIKRKEKESIDVVDEKIEPNPWLRRVLWHQHLEGKNMRQLTKAIKPAETSCDAKHERELGAIIESFRRVVSAAQEKGVRDIVGINALFEINKKLAATKPVMPFSTAMGDKTLKNYRGYWEQLLCYLYRTQEVDEFVAERPAYKLTVSQEDIYDRLIEAIEKGGNRNRLAPQDQNQQRTPREEEAELRRVDTLCLELCIALLDHPLEGGEYESVVISGMAVLGCREDGGWLSAEDYTTKYSGVIKVARMLVLYQSYIEREEEYEANRKTMDEAAAREATEPMLHILQRSVRKFMTLVSGDGQPTPMDWMYECRTYGMKIRYNTTAQGIIEWQGNKVLCQKIRFNMDELRGMIHGLAEEARTDLMTLLMLKLNGDDEVEEGTLPRIEWETLNDCPGEERIGWSFLKSPENRWSVDGEWWLLQRVAQEPRLSKVWLRRDLQEGDQQPYGAEAAMDYQRQVTNFQEKLLLLMHMVGGQPARGMELLGLRFMNTKQGGLRNIFIDRGMVVFVTAYHKGYQQFGTTKVIHRYLPREVGELVVRYLWLVLPFWQAVESVMKKADKLSPFLWSDATMETNRVERGEEEGTGEDGDEYNRDGNTEEDDVVLRSASGQVLRQSKQWTSERLRKIMQQQSEKWLGTRVNLSSWRHIVIGISRRYLNGRFATDEANEDGDLDEQGEESIDGDNPWDLQAGHGTHMAGIIYARELRQAPGQTARRQDLFREVSQSWHRFLGFMSSQQGFGTKLGMKRPRSEWEHIGQEVQARRFKRIRAIDIKSKLKEFMGSNATFRGKQEETLAAIMKGESPIISVMATGEGKSLLFMLPTFCVSGGTTVVIIPLNSLQEDLEQRCTEAHIHTVRWDVRRPREPASIIFVTPESAVSKTFSTHINWLRATYQLDRVVMDECHVVLDSGLSFRPKLRELGAEMVQMSTQLVYLTATLPPRDEEEFCRAMEIPTIYARMFRGPTTRRNIRYEVREAGEQPVIEAVQELVSEKLIQYIAPAKIIIYGGSVEQTEELAAALRTPSYYRHVDDQMGKARRLKEFKDGTKRVICATNALGLGIDLPDIRVVIHVGIPRQLRDYAQESGRAGRDRQTSEAIIVCQDMKASQRPVRQSWINTATEDMREFIAEYHCRRVVLDSVMDGRTDRARCEEGEERCDICERKDRREASREMWEWERSSTVLARGDLSLADRLMTPSNMDGQPREETREDAGDIAFQKQQRERQWLEMETRMRRRKAGQEAADFEAELAAWANKCPLCRLRQKHNTHHRLDNCIDPEADGLLKLVCTVKNGIQGKRRFAEYSCCFRCGVPQSICQMWKRKEQDKQGRYERAPGVTCQYNDVVIPVVTLIWEAWESSEADIIEEWLEKDGKEMGDTEGIYRWLGQRVNWAGMEATKLCQVFYRLSKMVRREQERSELNNMNRRSIVGL